MQLSGVAKEIADVIGRERALYLIGKLPRCFCKSNGSAQREYVVMYVPKQVSTSHNLVKILGWKDANRLVMHFGGEILYPPNCSAIYRQYRDASIIRLHSEGMAKADIITLMQVSERHVRNLIKEKPQEDLPKASNDNRPIVKLRAKNGRPQRTSLAT
jgi:hypothetical protein